MPPMLFTRWKKILTTTESYQNGFPLFVLFTSNFFQIQPLLLRSFRGVALLWFGPGMSLTIHSDNTRTQSKFSSIEQTSLGAFSVTHMKSIRGCVILTKNVPNMLFCDLGVRNSSLFKSDFFAEKASKL